MARSISTIYEAIIAEKESQSSLDGLLPANEEYTTFLSDLSSASKVAIWRLWAYITAVAIHTHEVVYDLFKEEVQAIADAAAPGTPAWYQKKVLEFQYEDSLVYQDFQYIYDPIDEDARIITRCAVQERSDGAVLIKVAKDVSDEPAPLITAEKNALESYVAKIKFAGTRVAVLSQAADVIDLDYAIYYDPLIPLATVKANLQAQMDAFLAQLDFNAEFRITRFTDFLQQAEGVVDPVFNSASVTPDGGSAQAVQIRYLPVAGYFEYADTAANMFTYIEQI